MSASILPARQTKRAWIPGFAGFAVEKSGFIRVHSWLNFLVPVEFHCGKQSTAGKVRIRPSARSAARIIFPRQCKVGLWQKTAGRRRAILYRVPSLI
jgi:hypothetical protein